VRFPFPRLQCIQSSQHFNACASSGRTFSSDSSDSSDSVTSYWKKNGLNRFQRPIYIAGTKQHAGKTTVSLALVSGLQKIYGKVGFIKPVGQQHVKVKSENLSETIRVDKDVTLMREHFNLHHVDYEYMSPVIIPQGYTKDYVDGKISSESQMADIRRAFDHVSDVSDVMLCEGTGHCAVGSIVGSNNAKVAAMIGADMILVAGGGLGSAFDELELNRVLCQHYGVRLAGVVVNRVRPDKYDQTKHYLSKALMQSWGVPLLGCVPDRTFLGCPALADLEKLFKTKLISGSERRMQHYTVNDMNLVTTSLKVFLENLREKPIRTLYVCHATRNDIILGFLAEFQRRKQTKEDFEATLIVCARKGKYELGSSVKDMIEGSSGAPILFVERSTHQTMGMIRDLTPKFNLDDKHRVEEAVKHYQPYIDFDELLRRTTSSNSSFNDPSSIAFDDLHKL